MLGGKKNSFAGSSATTLISRDTVVVGDIHFSGNLDIEGTVRGNIIANPEKDAVLRVVEQGRVEGDIMAPSVIINGSVAGDVASTAHLELAAKARVEGNVQYALVEMAIGSDVNGSLKHHAVPETGKAGRKAAKEAKQAAEESFDGGNRLRALPDHPAFGSVDREALDAGELFLLREQNLGVHLADAVDFDLDGAPEQGFEVLAQVGEHVLEDVRESGPLPRAQTQRTAEVAHVGRAFVLRSLRPEQGFDFFGLDVRHGLTGPGAFRSRCCERDRTCRR